MIEGLADEWTKKLGPRVSMEWVDRMALQSESIRFLPALSNLAKRRQRTIKMRQTCQAITHSKIPGESLTEQTRQSFVVHSQIGHRPLKRDKTWPSLESLIWSLTYYLKIVDLADLRKTLSILLVVSASASGKIYSTKTHSRGDRNKFPSLSLCPQLWSEELALHYKSVLPPNLVGGPPSAFLPPKIGSETEPRGKKWMKRGKSCCLFALHTFTIH